MIRIQRLFSNLFIVQLCVMWQALAFAEDPLVTSKVGHIRGHKASDGDYNMFLGIPYGKVDNENPFGTAVPFPKFEHTFEAVDESAVCPQRENNNNTLVGTLECLTLNLYIPTDASSSNRLPVLIFIFGGAFEHGYANRYTFGPKFLVKHDIVLVTMNYRVGPYGFMCLDNPKIPGNQGLKDQRLALRWIKDNIEDFGGDANKITLSGESSGSASVDIHIHSNEETLFQQAILQSGTVLTPFVFVNPGKEGPLKMARYLGYDTDDVNKAISFLVTADTNDVIVASEKNNLTFSVCPEKKFDNIEPIVTDYAVNLLAPKVKNINILTGFNDEEELIHYGTSAVNDTYLQNNDVFQKHINAIFNFDNCTYDEMKTILKHFYFGDGKVDIKARQQIVNMTSDLRGIYPVLRTLRKYFECGAKTIFCYMFSYVGERNYAKYKGNITIGGSAHGDELGYLYDVSFIKQYISEEDRNMIDVMTTLWSNFVKYGNPTPETTKLLPVTWIPVTREQWNYLLIDTNLAMGTRPFNQRMTFLDLFFKINEKHQIGYRKNNDHYGCNEYQDTNLAMGTRPFNQRMTFLDLFIIINEKYQIGYHNNNENDGCNDYQL